MLETFTTAGSRDFRQRYSGSFGYYTVPATQKRLLVQVNTVDESVAQFHDAKDAIYTARSDEGVEFEFIPIQKTLFVLENQLMYIRRKPARQWSRGVNNNNTQLTCVPTQRDRKLTFPAVVQAFATDFPDGYTSVTKLEKGEANAVVLSRMFGVQDSVLYLYDAIVGAWAADTKEIIVEEPMFKQEVTDLVARLGINYKVRDGNTQG